MGTYFRTSSSLLQSLFWTVVRHVLGAVCLQDTPCSSHLPGDGNADSAIVDSTLLRVCRKMYTEALPLLYGENTFCFNSVSGLHTFRSEGLAQKRREWRYVPIFNLRTNSNGRFSMVKKLSLNLTSENHFSISPTPSVRRVQDRGTYLRSSSPRFKDSVGSDGTILQPTLARG